MSTTASIAWVREELEAHGALENLKEPLVDTRSLCAFLKDGRALCLLTNALTQGERESESELPKKLQRSLNQLSTFHALERVQFFIKWCRSRAQLDEHQIFTTVQLLDEVNEVAVNECIVALQKKYRPTAANKMAQFFDPNPANDENRLSGHNIGPASSIAPPQSTGSTANSSNRLSAFLNKFPTAPPVKATVTNPPPQPVKAPLPAVSVPKPMTNRSSSISSVTSASSELQRGSTTSFSEEIEDDAFDRTSSASASADRTSSASASATSPKQQTTTSRLRIPSIFKNNRSSSSTNTTTSTSRSSLTNSNGPPTPSNDSSEGSAPRSVSKLSIPAAFSGRFSSSSNGSGGDASHSPPSSPPSKLSAFAAFSNQSKSAPASVNKDSSVKSAPASKLAAFLTSVVPSSTPGPAIAAPSQREEEAAPPAQPEDAHEEAEEEVTPIEEPVEDDSESHHNESFHSLDGSDRRYSIQSDRRSSIQSDRDHSFFVVEEVSVNHQSANHQPPQQSQSSSKLHAFLSVVEPTVADGPVSFEAPAPAGDAEQVQDDAQIEETSEPIEEEVAAPLPKADIEESSVDVPEPKVQEVAVSSELVEENERLVSENARLNDEISSLAAEKESVSEELRLVNESIAGKDDLIEALRSELASTQQQLADAQEAVDAKAQEAAQTEAALRQEVSEAQAQLEAARQAAEAGVNDADEEKRDLADQVRELTAAAESHSSELASLREQLEALEQAVQLAKDQEEAARFAAQTAFAARDAAEERAAQLEAQLKQ